MNNTNKFALFKIMIDIVCFISVHYSYLKILNHIYLYIKNYKRYFIFIFFNIIVICYNMHSKLERDGLDNDHFIYNYK